MSNLRKELHINGQKNKKALKYLTICNPTVDIPPNANNTSNGIEHHANDQASSVVAELSMEKDAFLGYVAHFEEGSPNGQPRNSENYRGDSDSRKYDNNVHNLDDKNYKYQGGADLLFGLLTIAPPS